jgi:hypothetical protein
MVAESQRPEFVVPEQATGRGPIMSGELRSTHSRFPAMLAQFSKVLPHTRKARIYLFPTVEQAKLLYGSSGPFSFEASFVPQDGVIESYKASDIWLDSGSQIVNREAVYWTQTSGKIGSFETKMTYLSGPELDSRSEDHPAWFVAGRCFALQIIANPDEEELESATKFGSSRPEISLTLSDGSQATVQRYMRFHRRGVGREVQRNGYAITVRGIKDPRAAKRDVDALLILASFASRERSVNAHWSCETKGDWTRTWRFNFAKFPGRGDREDPLVLRDREECRAFLQRAFEVYSASKHQALLDSAVFALLDKKQTMELRVMHLFSGIQGALIFATQSMATRPPVGELYRRFLKAHPKAFDGLWPLLDPRTGPPLVDFRNAIVHGGAFSEGDWVALSYAGDHLRWHLERIILVTLGWDIEKSYVSDRVLRHFYAHAEWKAEQSKLVTRKDTP